MSTGYFWLNQRVSGSGYQNRVGEIYHYRGTTPGSNQLSEGDKFVYYRPGEYIIFGTGVVGSIEIVQPKENRSNFMKQYFANIDNYKEIRPPIEAREIKEKIPFLRDRHGLSGVPQSGIRKIDKEVYDTILSEAKNLVDT